MARFEVVNATLEHGYYIADRLRDMDKQEVLAVSPYSLRDSLAESITQSESAFTGLLNGEPIGCYGVVRLSLLCKHGRPWLLASDRIYECRISVLKESRKFLKYLDEKYSYVSNYVGADNRTSIAWLKWLGFTVHDAKAVGKYGEPFCYFEKGTR